MLLACAVLILPACGSKESVQSNKAPESMLNPETTPVAAGNESNGEKPVGSYVEKIHRNKGLKSTTTISTTSANGETTPAPNQMTPAQMPAMETPAPVQKSGGAHWFLWFLVLLVLGGIGWYFWSKNQSDNNMPSQPKPPTGGLSPVSGFTGVKGHVEDEGESKPSFWSKKIF